MQNRRAVAVGNGHRVQAAAAVTGNPRRVCELLGDDKKRSPCASIMGVSSGTVQTTTKTGPTREGVEATTGFVERTEVDHADEGSSDATPSDRRQSALATTSAGPREDDREAALAAAPRNVSIPWSERSANDWKQGSECRSSMHSGAAYP